jgi:site-specific DNA-methyltransferase (adenine-specific)
MKIEGAVLLEGDCLELLRTLDDCSVDAVVTDPPYSLRFMGRAWDYDVPGVEVWVECLRVLKPGGHLLAFAGTRTQHRMAAGIEDAGFEIRDMIMWAYGSGFPKSMDVSKAMDMAAGAEREEVGIAGKSGSKRNSMAGDFAGGEYMTTAPATEAAKQWGGWGTALKPALEPITVARKPLIGTVAANVLEHGTGGINVDGCRIGTDVVGGNGSKPSCTGNVYSGGWHRRAPNPTVGRWPANLIHDGSEEVCRLLRDAARFFYTAKASGADREGNTHPTVKPTDLMRYLCRLVTPPGGAVLDPFMGSGSTGVAALLEGFRFVGIERESEYMRIAEQRISSRTRCIQRRLF